MNVGTTRTRAGRIDTLSGRGVSTNICEAQVKLLDFGLVKAVDSKASAMLTQANTWSGTPMYMAPEAYKAPQDVDARSDIYAVGAVGFLLLAGLPVFDGHSITEISHKHLSEEAPLVSERMGNLISKELERIIAKCLNKLPVYNEQRPHSSLNYATPQAYRLAWEQRNTIQPSKENLSLSVAPK